MEMLPLVVFRHHGSLYGVEAHGVIEMTRLPELTPIEEAPVYVAGIFSLRGRFVSVIDLDRRFNHTGLRYSTDDCVIVIEAAGMVSGIIVNEILDVKLFEHSDVQSVNTWARPDEHRSGFIKGEARLEDEILMVLDVERLLRDTHEFKTEAAPAEHGSFCPDAAPEEKEVFRGRAHSLAAAPAADTSALVPLAVVTLSGERYAFELEHVLEFADVKDAAPVPCCPAHVKGDLNLRGDLLTIIDIRGLLDIEPPADGAAAKAVLVDVGGIRAGVLADDILEVGFYSPPDPSMIPAAVSAPDNGFIKGVSNAGGAGHLAVTVIDLRKMFENGGLVVDETV